LRELAENGAFRLCWVLDVEKDAGRSRVELDRLASVSAGSRFPNCYR